MNNNNQEERNLTNISSDITYSCDFIGTYSIDEFDANLDNIKKRAREAIAEHPELVNPQVSVDLEYNDYDDSGRQHLEICIVGKRPMTQIEIENRNAAENKKAEWE